MLLRKRPNCFQINQIGTLQAKQVYLRKFIMHWPKRHTRSDLIDLNEQYQRIALFYLFTPLLMTFTKILSVWRCWELIVNSVVYGRYLKRFLRISAHNVQSSSGTRSASASIQPILTMRISTAIILLSQLKIFNSVMNFQ